MHKDLSSLSRKAIEHEAKTLAKDLTLDSQSLALAREAWIAAFDKAAEELEANDGDA